MKIHILSLAALCASCGSNVVPKEPKTPVERQMLGLLEKFDRWDLDGNGALDEAELTEGLKDRGAPYKPKEVMDFYDTSGNGSISLREAQLGFKRTNEVKFYTNQ